MKQQILILNNEPFISEAYISELSRYGFDFNFVYAKNCREGYERIILNPGLFDIVLADVFLAPFEDQDLFCVTDFILFAKAMQPDLKILMTCDAHSYSCYHLITKIKPDGLLFKDEFTSKEFVSAFTKIVNGETHYSYAVKHNLKTMQIKEVYLDTCNRRIISLLAKGIKTKNLPSHLNLSISAIDKRKAQIKEMFNIEKGTDEDILRESKKHGFI